MSLQRPSIRYGAQLVFGIVLLLLLASPVLASPLQQNCAIMTFSPTTVSDVEVGDIVILQVLLDADGVTFDTVGFLINFDPTVLQVVDAAGDPASQIEPGDVPADLAGPNTASNTAGTIDFAQGISGGQTGGTFTVATIRLKVIVTLPAGGTRVRFVDGLGNTGVFQAGGQLLCEFPGPATICGVLIPVGGVIIPVNRLELLALRPFDWAQGILRSGQALWIGLAALASLAALAVALVRGRRSVQT
jgi:hypothetical protein